MLINSTAV